MAPNFLEKLIQKKGTQKMVTIVKPTPHNFLNMARDYEWDQVFNMLELKPDLINEYPNARMTALHQAVEKFYKTGEPEKPPIQKIITNALKTIIFT